MTPTITDKEYPEPTATIREKEEINGFFKKNSAFFIYLAVTFIYFSVILLTCKQGYWINDDLGILDDIKNDFWVSFMSVLLGKFMSLLYVHVSGRIPWYGIFLYLFAAISFFLMLYSIDKSCVNKWMKFGILSVLLIAYARFVLTIGYSTVSINIGFSSLLALLVYRRTCERPRVWIILGFGFCCAISYLVRTRGFTAVMVFSLVILFYEMFWKPSKKGWVLIFFFIPLLVLAGADRLYIKYAAHESYRQYTAWNTARGKFHGYPARRINKKNALLLKKNNWSINDYKMLIRWIYFDENKFNLKTMQNLFTYSPPLPHQQPPDFPVILQNMGRLLLGYPPFTSMLILLFLIGLVTADQYRLFILSVYLAYVFSGAAVMQTVFRFPPRVAIPVFMGATLLCCYWVFIENRRPVLRFRWNKKNIRKYLIWGLSFCFMALGLSDTIRIRHRIANNARYQKMYYEHRAYLENLNADFLILKEFGGLYAAHRDPLKVHSPSFRSIPTSWPIFSPRFYQELSRLNLNHGYEILPRTVDQKKVFIVGTTAFVGNIVTFLKENHGIDCRYEQIDRVNPKTGVYRIITQ